MIVDGPCLLDTNILLHLVNRGSREHTPVRQCLESLWESGLDITYTSQNIAEFWNVCTRPLDKNGFGLSIAEVDERASMIETQFRLAADSEVVHREWRQLIVENRVSGVRVHDARIVAAMRTHGIKYLLTYNLCDFRRFQGVVSVSPVEIVNTGPPRA